MSDPIPVVYEDAFCVVFEKPAGMLTVPTPKNEKFTLDRVVNVQCRQTPAASRLFPCHRLDRDTSGVILFAKGRQNQEILMRDFKERRIRKTYIAFVQGRLPYPAGEIKSEIKDAPEQRFHRHSKAKLAITQYKVKDRRKAFTVVEVYPLTGRTNQIRIHFSEIGHPLVGERLYAFGRDYELKFRRAALHASSLEWRQIKSGQPVRASAPLPEDMNQFIMRNP